MDFTGLPSQESKKDIIEKPDFKKGVKIFNDFFIWYLDTTEKIVQTGKISQEDYSKFVKISELTKGRHPEVSKNIHPELLSQMQHLLSNVETLLKEVSRKRNQQN